MSCGCAGRMRKYVLPFFGYELDVNEGVWRRAGAPGIPDNEVSEHYTRLIAEIVLREGFDRLEEILHRD